jgi:hypothetical protein
MDESSGGAFFGGAAENGASFTTTFVFDRRLDADWIYAADFAARSNAVYLSRYSGKVVMIDSAGEPRRR